MWPERYPLTARLGVSDFNAASQPLEESIELTKRFKSLGLDLIDVSIGYNSPDVSGVPWGPAFMVPVAERVRREVQMPTAASWFIADPKQADAIVREERVDLVMLAHAMLDDPHWPYHAARALEIPKAKWTLPAAYAHWIRG